MKVNRRNRLIDYKSIVFMDYQKIAHEYFTANEIAELKYKMTLIFRDFLKYKMWKYELHQNLDNSCMALGERVCLNLSFVIAIQKIETVKLSLPEENILDYLDAELRQGVSESLFYRELISATIANKQ
ncbi:hypothetical protein [Colwellia piezophila]|uniref:hypothetical protein n=1 Tax=Colwellia piezophila TaxID=211668 RepID=UPI0012F72CCA|nr:hypothetical protein [Colwellia piezophila]